MQAEWLEHHHYGRRGAAKANGAGAGAAGN